jgi:hypothetical protein
VEDPIPMNISRIGAAVSAGLAIAVLSLAGAGQLTQTAHAQGAACTLSDLVLLDAGTGVAVPPAIDAVTQDLDGVDAVAPDVDTVDTEPVSAPAVADVAFDEETCAYLQSLLSVLPGSAIGTIAGPDVGNFFEGGCTLEDVVESLQGTSLLLTGAIAAPSVGLSEEACVSLQTVLNMVAAGELAPLGGASVGELLQDTTPDITDTTVEEPIEAAEADEEASDATDETDETAETPVDEADVEGADVEGAATEDAAVEDAGAEESEATETEVAESEESDPSSEEEPTSEEEVAPSDEESTPVELEAVPVDEVS